MVADALVFSACLVAVFASFYVALRVWVSRERQRIKDDLAQALRDFVTSPDDNTPSPLAVYSDMVATLLAARFTQQVKTMLAGTESGLAKGEAAGQQLALLENAPPWLGLVAGALPKRLRTQMLKNPQMVGALSNMLAPKNGGDGASAAGSVRNRLERKEG